jgi:hypothetical protein
MPVGFGPKNSWIAAADVSARELADALGLGVLEPADWEAGVALAYESSQPGYKGVGVFITPPLKKWTLCVGLTFFDRKKGFAAEISQRLGGREVQHFFTHRVTEAHSWERAIDGKTTRYGLEVGSDGIEIREGELTPEEVACGFTINPPDDEDPPDDDDDQDYWFPDENFIFELAGAWSIDPTLLDTSFPEVGPGWIVRLMPKPAALSEDKEEALQPSAPSEDREDPPQPSAPSVPSMSTAPRRSWFSGIRNAFRRP